PFDALKVKRYLLQVKQRDGEFVPGDITLGQCRIPAAKLQDTEKLQEITCE
ncbi:hypothetical protein ACEZGM_005252, partial [Escherichia coli]